MFAFQDEHQVVFIKSDPRCSGFKGTVEEDVELYFPVEVYDWPDGEDLPKICVGVSEKNPKWFKVFSQPEYCRKAGYRKVANGPPKIYESLADFRLKKAQRSLMPEHGKECIAINLESGDYVLGETPNEVEEAFRKRWRNKPKFVGHVDGSPLMKFHSPFVRKVGK